MRLENPTKAREYFAKISDNIAVKDIQDWSLDESRRIY